ncbi:MAG: hypothetical protein E6I77_02050 [Chloroflexi bacterium]|nr:MAG: hypothetical protein E6I77_02050 [Chloroflexota bacterium]
MRLRSRILAVLGVVILAGLALLVVIGAQVSDFWATHIWAGGFINNTATLAPFPAFSSVEVFSLDDPNFHQVHYYLLGSDAGGRDLFALVAKGALPSLVLVALALAGRMLIGVVAGFGIASGATVFRSAARAAGGWIAGFPYLALAVAESNGCRRSRSRWAPAPSARPGSTSSAATCGPICAPP